MKILDHEAGLLALGHFQMATTMLGNEDAVVTCTRLVIPEGSADVYVQALRASAAYDLPVGEFVWESFDGQCSAENSEPFTGGRLTAANPPASGTIITRFKCTEPPLSTVHLADTEL